MRLVLVEIDRLIVALAVHGRAQPKPQGRAVPTLFAPDAREQGAERSSFPLASRENPNTQIPQASGQRGPSPLALLTSTPVPRVEKGSKSTFALGIERGTTRLIV